MKKTNLTQSGAELAAKAGVITLANPETAKVNKIKIIATAVLLSLATACGQAFTSGTSQPDGGVAGGGSGGAGAQAGAPVGGGNTGGLDGGNAGTGGQAGGPDGGGGGGCAEKPVSFSNMAQYEYKAYQTSCAGPIVASSLGNANFETGPTNLCLPAGFNYRIIVQVKDAPDMNSLEINTTEGSVSSVGVATLGATTPIDDTTTDSLCVATAGWTDLNPVDDDKNPSPGKYKFNGNTEGDAGLPASNAFKIEL